MDIRAISMIFAPPAETVIGSDMYVTVAIVGYRNPHDVVRCLDALSISDYQNFGVIICENGGDVAYSELTRLLPQTLDGGQTVQTFCAKENLGFAGGVNVCLAHAPTSDAYWVLNPDTEPSAEALGMLLERLSVGDCDAVSSTVYFPDGMVQSFGGHWEPDLGRSISIGYGLPVTTPPPHDIETRQNYLNGANMLVSRRFVETCGPMREDYFLYCEEVEWCLRAISKGLKLGFAPNAPVLHHQGTTMENFSDLKRRGPLSIYLTERNRIHLTRDLFPRSLLVVTASAIPYILYKFARRGAWKQSTYGIRGVLAALRGERGPPVWAVKI